MAEITLAKPVDMVLRAEEKKSVSKLTVKRIVKIPDEKKILVMVSELPKFIVAYSDKDYGDYTDAQVMDRVKALADIGLTFSN